MAKNDWRDSGKPKPTRQEREAKKSTVGSDGRAKSTLGARMQQFLWLLGTAALLAFLIRLFVPLIIPPKNTPFVLITNQKPDTFLSNTPFHNETIGLFGANIVELAEQGKSKGIPNLAFQETNFDGLAELDLRARGPGQDMAMFYLFAEQFVDADGKAVLIGDDAKESSENSSFEEILRKICKLDLKLDNVNRLVILDAGRLNKITSGLVLPGDFATQTDQILRTLRSENVPNADKLWIYLSHSDHQHAWTAPELNSSVFGFFVALGLEGYADSNKDWVVTLAELNRYVDVSVRHWAANYRDSIQTPMLLGATPENTTESVKVIHCVPQDESRTADRLATDKMDHESYWAQGYQLTTPHAKHKIFGRLARLETLRYSKCSEYNNQTTRVRELVSDAQPAPRISRNSNSLYDQPYRVSETISALAIEELKLFLAPVVQTNPEVPPKPPELGEQLLDMATVPQKRAQILWEFLQRDDLEEWFDVEKFRRAMKLFDGRAMCQSVVQSDEIQFLVALEVGVPWEKPGFAMSLVSEAIRTRQSANELSRGILPIPNSVLSEYCEGYEREWRLIETRLKKLDDQRREADDRLFAGEFSGLTKSYQEVTKQYRALATTLRKYVSARKSAEDALVMVPYLKAYVANDAICRPARIGTEKNNSFLSAIAAIQSEATRVLRFLNTNELRDLELSFEALQDASKTVVNTLTEVVGTAEQTQTGAVYVFEALLLLESPLIEWIETKEQKENLRSKIASNLKESLRKQQEECFTTLADFGNKEEVVEKLANPNQDGHLAIKTWLANTWPKTDEKWADEYVGTWDQLQVKQKEVPVTYKSIRNENVAFQGLQQVIDETTNLEKRRLDLLKGGQILAFGRGTTDLTKQLQWLRQFVFETKQAERSFSDLLGNAEANSGRPFPFVQYTNDFLDNAKANARELANNRIGTELFQPYDSDSLPTLTEEFSASVRNVEQQLKSSVSRLQFNGQPIAERSQKFDPRQTNQVANDLNSLSTSLQQNPWVGKQFSDNKWIPQSRWVVEDEERFVTQWEIPKNQKSRMDTQLRQVFRGHVFASDLTLTPIKPKLVKFSELSFSPLLKTPKQSEVTVTNDSVTEVDLYFLIDCSVSMRDADGDDRINRLVRTAVTNTIKELAKSQRFHIGIAAFGSQSRFKNGDLVNLKQPYEGPKHPMLDFRIGIQADPETVSTPNNIDAELRYVDELKAKSQITNLYFSIKKLLQQMDKRNSGRKKVLLVLTDGEDTQQFFPNGQPYTNDYFPNVGFEPTKLDDLIEYRKQFNDVQILMIQTNTDFAKQRQAQEEKFGPAQIQWVGLDEDPKMELQNYIFNAVKRQLYAMTSSSSPAKTTDFKSIGKSTLIKVGKPTSYTVETREVETPDKLNLNLSGGEKLRLVNSANGLYIKSGRPTNTPVNDYPRFLPPVLPQPVELGNSRYRVGLEGSSQRSNSLRIGFFRLQSRKKNSEFPSRVWGWATDDLQRSYYLPLSNREFSNYPTIELELPTFSTSAPRPKSLDLTLFVRPSVFENPNNETKPHRFTVSKTILGMNVQVQGGDGDQLKIVMTDSSEKFRPFHLDAPGSKPFGVPPIDYFRKLTYGDNQLRENEFAFNFPAGSEPRFELFLQTEDFVKTELAKIPDENGAVKILDPIFGDEVQAIRFKNISVAD